MKIQFTSYISLIFIMMAFTFSLLITQPAAANIDIAIYNTSCGKFEVRLRSDMDISNSYITNIQFTLKWPTNSVNLINFHSDFGVESQNSIIIEDNANYLVFVSVVPIPINWTSETEYTILSFAHDQSGNSLADFEIDTGLWSITNNGIYYVELLGMNQTGTVSQNANNVLLGTCGKLDIKAFLQGPYNSSNGLMNVNLYATSVLPSFQPYNKPPWNYPGAENIALMPTTVVDWILVELRDAPDVVSASIATRFSRQAALLLSDGSIVGINGSSLLDFNNSAVQHLFVILWHRNHLGIISDSEVAQSPEDYYTYNFTTSATQAFDDGQIYLDDNMYGMMSGDANADGIINMLDDILIWRTQAGSSGYLDADYNLNGQVNNPDKNEIWLQNINKDSKVPD